MTQTVLYPIQLNFSFGSAGSKQHSRLDTLAKEQEEMTTQPSSDAPKIVVHHLEDSRSQRILWLLEELDLPYEIKHYSRDPETKRAPKELLEVNPLGKAPAITDGDMNLSESGAIVEYLIDKYGNGRFQVPPSGKIDNFYYVHYSEGSFMPILTNYYMFTVISDRSPWFLRPLLRLVFGRLNSIIIFPALKKNMEVIEAHLARSTTGWFAGGREPTSADFMMIFPLEAVCSVVPDYAGPAVKEYVERIHKRITYKRALERGGEYTFA